MAPKKKLGKPSKQDENDSFPGLRGPGGPAPKTRYQELQDDEVIALQAIYGEDFIQHSAAHTAWHVRLSRKQNLLVRS